MCCSFNILINLCEFCFNIFISMIYLISVSASFTTFLTASIASIPFIFNADNLS